MELVLEVAEDRVVEDDEFLVYVDGLVLDLEVKVVWLAFFDVWVFANSLVPVNGRTPGVVYLVDLGEEVTVV